MNPKYFLSVRHHYRYEHRQKVRCTFDTAISNVIFRFSNLQCVVVQRENYCHLNKLRERKIIETLALRFKLNKNEEKNAR